METMIIYLFIYFKTAGEKGTIIFFLILNAYFWHLPTSEILRKNILISEYTEYSLPKSDLLYVKLCILNSLFMSGWEENSGLEEFRVRKKFLSFSPSSSNSFVLFIFKKQKKNPEIVPYL